MYYNWTVEILRFRQFCLISSLPISSICGHETNKLLWKEGSFDTTAEGAAQWEGLSGAPVGGKGMAPFSILPPQTLAMESCPRPGPGSTRCIEKSACQQFKLWGVLCLRPLTPGCPSRCVSALWVRVGQAAAGVERYRCLRSYSHYCMVKEAVEHVWRFEGPWQTQHWHRDVVSCYQSCVTPPLILSLLLRAPIEARRSCSCSSCCGGQRWVAME